MSEVKRLCRVCMNNKSNLQLKPIFGDEMNEETATNIFLVTGVQIIDFPSCPALICQRCINDLSNAIEFRIRCKNADQIIRQTEEFSYWKTVNNPAVDAQFGFKQEVESSTIKIEELEQEPEIDFYSLTNPETQISTQDPSASGDYDQNTGTDNIFTDYISISKAEIFGCELCERKFYNEKDFNLHRSKAHRKHKESFAKIGCQYCHKFFMNIRAAQKHINYKHETEDFRCDICDEVFPYKSKLPRHFRVAHKIRAKNEKKKLIKPKKERKPQKLQAFPCSVCGRICKSRSFLLAHEKSHSKLKPEDYFYCDICGNKFKRIKQLKNHIFQRHVQQIRWTCPQCPGKSWARRDHMLRHYRVVHERILKFKCDICDRGFPERVKLENHQRIHTGEKPFLCKDCGKRFMHEVDYIRHVWNHKGSRKFKCMSCRGVYDTKEELKAHRSSCAFYSYNPNVTYL